MTLKYSNQYYLVWFLKSILEKKKNESLIGAQKTKYLTVLGTKEAPDECQKTPEPP